MALASGHPHSAVGSRKKKWVRKAPLISTGAKGKDRSVDPGSMKVKSILTDDKKGQKDTFEELKSKLLLFLSGAHKEPWGPEEKFRRFYIFGEYITCCQWEGKPWISGTDIFKAQCALYRLEYRKSVPLKRKFEECILTQLRSIEEGEGMRMEASGSPLINYLYSIGAIRTRKRQKIFEWDAVNHEELCRARRNAKQVGKVPVCLEKSKARSGYILKSLQIYEKPGIDALMKAADMVEVTSTPPPNEDIDDLNRSDSSFSM